jgi:putative hydrolase of the HAD superfamily
LIITKGDLLDQERKLAKSGLAAHFKGVEIVSEKNADTYASILRRHDVRPAEFLMVGNSLKSDILPVLEIGAAALHIPYPLAWMQDRTDQIPAPSDRFFQLGSLRELPALLSKS